MTDRAAGSVCLFSRANLLVDGWMDGWMDGQLMDLLGVQINQACFVTHQMSSQVVACRVYQPSSASRCIGDHQEDVDDKRPGACRLGSPPSLPRRLLCLEE